MRVVPGRGAREARCATACGGQACEAQASPLEVNPAKGGLNGVEEGKEGG